MRCPCTWVMGLFHTLPARTNRRESSGWLESSRLREEGRPPSASLRRPCHSPPRQTCPPPRSAAPPRYSLGFPPWGAPSPGAGSDLHVPHFQSARKMNWLHSIPATYTRKNVWSAASTQLFAGPLTPLGAAAGRGRESRCTQGSASLHAPAHAHWLVESQLMNIWAWPILGPPVM